MLAISLLSFCLTAFLLLDTIIRKSDFFSPARLYLFFHSLTLGIAFLGFHEAMTPFKPLTHLVYFGSGACFVLGCWVAGLLDSLGSKAPVRPYAHLPDLAGYNWRIHWGFALLLFGFFILGMGLAYLGVGQFPLLAEDKARAIRDFFRVTFLASVGLSFGGVAMGLFFITVFRPRTGPRLLNAGLWMTAITVAIFMLALSRSGLIFFAFFAVVFYNYAVKRLSIGRMSGLFVMFLGVFVLTAMLKLNSMQKDFKTSFTNVQLIELMAKVPYIYVANNFWNLDHALNPENFEERHPPTYGFTMLSGILDMIVLPGGALGGNIRESGDFDDQFHVQSIKVRGLNTMGYQWGLYKDFGLAGVFLAPFAFGILVSILHLRARQAPNIFNISVYAFLAYYIGFSWFLAFWESIIYLYGLGYVALCCYVATRVPLRREGATHGAEPAHS